MKTAEIQTENFIPIQEEAPRNDLPVGRSGFADLRRNHFYYVDKSGLISELLKAEGVQVMLITRPRRFGKTLAMSMLSEFFDLQKDSRTLFEGLEILQEQTLCEKWMNAWPTVFVSFREVNGLQFTSACTRMQECMSDLYKGHLYLMDSTKLTDLDKELFFRIAAQKGDIEETGNGLTLLVRLLSTHFGKPVIVLVDEYDVPLAKASENGYYPEMLDLIRKIMRVFKDNPCLKLAVITGCLRMAKESIFTGTNNFSMDSISDIRFHKFFGFTQEEVDQLLEEKKLLSHRSEIQAWYDGYHFGKADVYCPWDVISYVSDLLLGNASGPRAYWKNSSDNAIIRSFIERLRPTITQNFETLLAGGTIVQDIQEGLTYNDLYTSNNETVLEDNFWSVLYLTGYLTTDRRLAITAEDRRQGNTALKIPNREIREIYEGSIISWFSETAQKQDRSRLFFAVWNGDEKEISVQMNTLLRKTISYHDYREDFYHAFIAGIFAGAGYIVQSNREHGEGRSDITVQDNDGDRAAVFEIKYAESLSSMEKRCNDALAQIDVRQYAEDFSDDYAQVFCYRISFYKKRCLVKCRRT